MQNKINKRLYKLHSGSYHGLLNFSKFCKAKGTSFPIVSMYTDAELFPLVFEYILSENICIFFHNDTFFVKSIDIERDSILAKGIGESISMTVPELGLTIPTLYYAGLYDYDKIQEPYFKIFSMIVMLYDEAHNSIIDISHENNDDVIPF